jgi:hypothetical protein
MAFGVLMLSISVGTIAYMNYDYDNRLQKQNTVKEEDGTTIISSSRWD